MNVDARFFKLAATGAFAVVLIVSLQAVVSFTHPDPVDVEGQIAARADPYWLAAQWLPMLTLFPAVLALGALGLIKRGTHGGLVFTGLLAVLVWGLMELLTRSEGLVTVNGLWVERAASLVDPAARARWVEQIQAVQELHAAHFKLISFAGMVYGLCFGLATWRGKGLEKALSVAFFAYVALMIAYRLNMLDGPIGDVAYFAVRIPDRALLGAWLWRYGSAENSGRLAGAGKNAGATA